jgi:hypothetical protein
LTWPEFRAFVNHLPPTSALYRVQYPKSYWWTPELGFLAGILHAAQTANWQRGGGKGSRPKMAKQPKDRPLSARKRDPKSSDDLTARKQRMEDELAKRRERRVSSGRD